MWGRPPAVLLLILGFLYLAIVGTVRFYATIQTWEIIQVLYVERAPEYLLISGLFFVITALGLAIGLWVGRRWAWQLALYYIPGYWIVGWLERGVVALHWSWSPNTSFLIIFSIVVTIIPMGLLLHTSTRRFFTDGSF